MNEHLKAVIGSLIPALFAYLGYRRPDLVGRPWRFPPKLVRGVMLVLLIVSLAALSTALVRLLTN